MCECNLIVEEKTNKPIEISSKPHVFTYNDGKTGFELIQDITMNGKINHSAVYEIKGLHGFKHGYMFIIGEK